MYPPSIARDAPGAVAYVMAGSGESLTYGDLDSRSNRLAHYWRSRGIVAGDSVVLAMENNVHWPVAVAAGMRSGLCVTPVNWHLKPGEFAAIVAAEKPAVIVTSVGMAPLVGEALRSMSPGPRPVVVTVDGPVEGCVPLDEALAGQPSGPIEGELLGARVLYSSGTTGRPKRFAQPLLGVHPDQAPPRHSELVSRLGMDGDTVLLSPAPSYHAAPFTFQLIVLAAGGTVVCMEKFDTRAALQAINTYDVTHSQWVPTMLNRLLALPADERIALADHHQVAVTSGAPCPVHVKERIADWWGPVLHEYYGASEGYGHTYISPAEAAQRSGSVGRPLGAARVRIVDADGREVPAGTDGTVCFVSGGDVGAPLKEMGDIGHLDQDGYLYLVGRRGFMIISGGVNIYPDEVEAALLAHPGVADAAVIGVPDADLGEAVKAIVCLYPGAEVTERDIIDHARAGLAHFKAPRAVEFTNDLPRLPTGKLDKRSLVRHYRQGESS
ncbi:AMP-binding protein [Gordonia caeni]|uniref:Acyl-CoA synthetase n=1 Tax=Gordonia caeni TaxID=1007097 RepID=A0ABP7NN92_9ACTN